MVSGGKDSELGVMNVARMRGLFITLPITLKINAPVARDLIVHGA